MGKYEYLRKFINNSNSPAPRNSFTKIDAQDIKNAEDRLGFDFPESLKEFWLEIGSGVFAKSINGVSFLCYANYIFRPQQIADIMLLKEESDYILPTVFENELLKEGDIPFFEICDMQFFLVMKPNSDKPDAIYDIDKPGTVIEEHFERFIWRLYHESPDYYLHINKII